MLTLLHAQAPAEKARTQHLAAAEAVTQEASAKMIGLPPDSKVCDCFTAASSKFEEPWASGGLWKLQYIT